MSAIRSATPSLSVFCQRADAGCSASTRALRLLQLGDQRARRAPGPPALPARRAWSRTAARQAIEHVLTDRRAGPGRRRGRRPCAAGTRRAPGSRTRRSGRGPGYGPRAAAAPRTPGRLGRRSRPGAGGPVELDDPPPVRVQVGLGEHARRRSGTASSRRSGTPARARSTPARRPRPAATASAVGSADIVGRAVRRPEPADAGGVHQHQAGREQLARQPHLGAREPLPGCPGCRPRRRTRRAARPRPVVRSEAGRPD